MKRMIVTLSLAFATTSCVHSQTPNKPFTEAALGVGAVVGIVVLAVLAGGSCGNCELANAPQK